MHIMSLHISLLINKHLHNIWLDAYISKHIYYINNTHIYGYHIYISILYMHNIYIYISMDMDIYEEKERDWGFNSGIKLPSV